MPLRSALARGSRTLTLIPTNASSEVISAPIRGDLLFRSARLVRPRAVRSRSQRPPEYSLDPPRTRRRPHSPYERRKAVALLRVLRGRRPLRARRGRPPTWAHLRCPWSPFPCP